MNIMTEDELIVVESDNVTADKWDVFYTSCSEYDKAHFSWGFIDRAMRNLSREVAVIGERAGFICGIPRGGQLLAIMLSHQTGINFRSGPVRPGDILVDDIIETGNTIRTFCKMHDIKSDDVHVMSLFCSDFDKVPKGLTTHVCLEGYGHIMGRRVIFPWEI